MANVNAPFGAKPIGHINGSPYNAQANLYYLPASNGDAIYVGDFVKSRADADANGVPGVDKCAAGDTPLGIVVGVLGAYPGASMAGSALNLEQTNYVPAANAAAVYVMVADDPGLVFEIQCGATATNLVAAKLLYNFDITVAAPGTATDPRSGTIVDNSTINTTNTLVFKMLGLAQRPNNAIGAYQVVKACFNLHERSQTGTTAI